MSPVSAERVPRPDAADGDPLVSAFRRLARLLAGEPRAGSARREALPAPAERVASIFELTPFETDVLMLAAGAELDPRIGHELRAASGRPMPTVGVACTRLPDADWDALSPAGSLRRWGLIEMVARRPLVDSEFAVDEFVLAQLTGAAADDARLDGWARPRSDTPTGPVPRLALDRALTALAAGRSVVVVGADAARRWAAVARLSHRLGLGGDVSEVAAELVGRLDPDAAVIRRIARAALLRGALVAVEVASVDRRVADLVAAFGAVGVPLVVVAADSGDAGEYRLDVVAIGAERARVAAREQTGLVDTLEPRATLDEVVLPDEQHEAIRDFVGFARRREEIAGAWGGIRGHGASAMFSGESGTGKTLAAEAVAEALGMPLHVVDLGTVVSKWVGETPKNMSALFEQCADGVLLFDEADALFGRRGEVRDGTDRYANLEVSHLLTRLEHHRGVTILTTNLAPSIDTAFHRRLDAIVEFPMPDAGGRAVLWQRAFPAAIAVDDLDLARLVEIPVSGAVIRGIARRAASLAADRGIPVDTATVLEAARKEYRKLGRRPRGGELEWP